MFKGTMFSLAASSQFILVFFLVTLMKPLDGQEVFGWRMVFTVPCLTVLLVLTGCWPFVQGIWRRLRERKTFFCPLALSGLLFGIQLWIFVWGPVNGVALELALGYLLQPLCMVLCGMLVYHERLHPLQWAAVACAAVGVGNQVFNLGGISWVTLVPALGFPPYFVLRKHLRTDNLGGLWFDMLFTLPVGVAYLIFAPSHLFPLSDNIHLCLLIPLLGILSASSTAAYMLSSRYLPLGLFGLLGYVEPIGLVILSLLIGHSIKPGEGLTYLGVGMAVALLAMSGLWGMRQGRQRQRAS